MSAVLFPTTLTSTIRSTTSVSLSACRTLASALSPVAVLVRMASSSSSAGPDLAALAPLLPLYQSKYFVDLPNTFGAYLICTFLACM